MSNMNEFVTKMISDYENILKTVSSKLNEMKEFAKNNNINVAAQDTNVSNTVSSPSVDAVQQNDFKISFEKQRQAMIEQINKLKEDAKRQTQQAMEEATKMRSQIPTQMPQMPNMTVPQMPNMAMPQIPFNMPTPVVETQVPVAETTFVEAPETVVEAPVTVDEAPVPHDDTTPES